MAVHCSAVECSVEKCSDEGVFVELGGERVIRGGGDSSVRRDMSALCSVQCAV